MMGDDQMLPGNPSNGKLILEPQTVQSDPETSIPSVCDSSNSCNLTASAQSSALASGRDKLLRDISNFIPVGVLWLTGSPGTSMSYEYPRAEVLSLEHADWIRTSHKVGETAQTPPAIRIYVIPDDRSRISVSRSSSVLRRALKVVMSCIDTSPQGWGGYFEASHQGDTKKILENESLFYIFNTLNSPNPNIDEVTDPWARATMTELLNSSDELCRNPTSTGLKTPLYSYQRRSAAFMLQKESEPTRSLDPRLQRFCGPTGCSYYYDSEEGAIFSERKLYSDPRGGILAETMGSGKTLICLALILATRGFVPQIPCDHVDDLQPRRETTASLLQMAASAAGRHSVPWKSHFDRLESAGIYHDRCIAACESNRGSYLITRKPRYDRRASTPLNGFSTRLYLCPATLVVVPPNLIDHWLQEIKKHTLGLKFLVLRNPDDPTPPALQLLKYDVILFSRLRFQKECGGFSATTPVTYNSPLKELHWLRIIVDEGHDFASSRTKTDAIHFLSQLQVERRWVVSGTPSQGLYGIEISLASQVSTFSNSLSEQDQASKILNTRKIILKAREEEELKNLDKLRAIVTDFLIVQPWSNPRGSDPAKWSKYMHPSGQKSSGKSPLRGVLQSLIVRHRPEDIKLCLPKLYNEVVYLDPTFHDKLSQNLFVFQLTINAITSERTDKDYMFHRANRKHLTRLINNLRHAGFWWTGFEQKQIKEAIEVAKGYLKHSHSIPKADLLLLHQAIRIGEETIRCRSWNVLTEQHEVGVILRDFPKFACGYWAMDSASEHMASKLFGVSLAREARNYVVSHLHLPNPTDGICGAGIQAKSRRLQRSEASNRQAPEKGSLRSSDQPLHRSKPPSRRKKSASSFENRLPALSLFNATNIVATTSAKLTYLLDRILELHNSEKIIVFYENNSTADWIADSLEIIGVNYRIYANSLRTTQRSQYLTEFNESESIRVLLMDLRQASHGLHITAASRVFIVNPIWDPNIESQAIKRAHRISQTKPVYVETLVLKNTLEDKMLQRRKQMTNVELQHAEKDLLDDYTMNHIIQTEGFIPLDMESEDSMYAYFQAPLAFFGRHRHSIIDRVSDLVNPETSQKPDTSMSTAKPMPKRTNSLGSDGGLPEPKRRKALPTVNIVNDRGIVMMTPPSWIQNRPLSSSTASPSANTGSQGENVAQPMLQVV
ncbi:hypothetical protein FQN57_003068 [Myotisia sp. PD_48]|nr:hypothetical protein FQN57_003068 [Myotisia sp. PD_48]